MQCCYLKVEQIFIQFQKKSGHREIRTTEIYAKIIGEKMRQAINMIPKLYLFNTVFQPSAL